MARTYRRLILDWWSGQDPPLPPGFWTAPSGMPPDKGKFRIVHGVIRKRWTEGATNVDAIGERAPGANFNLDTSLAKRRRVEYLLAEYREPIGLLVMFAQRCFRAAVQRMTAGPPGQRTKVNRAKLGEAVATMAQNHYELHGPAVPDDDAALTVAVDGIVEVITRSFRDSLLAADKFEQRFRALHDDVWTTRGDATLKAFPPSHLLLGAKSRVPMLAAPKPAAPAASDASESAPNDWRLGTDRPVYTRYRAYNDERRIRPFNILREEAINDGRPLTPRYIYDFLAENSEDAIAEEAVRRAADRYGLVKKSHWEILQAAQGALFAPGPPKVALRSVSKYLRDHSHEPADGARVLVEAKVSKWRRLRPKWRDVDEEPSPDAMAEMMRKLWLCLQGQETYADEVIARGRLASELGTILFKIDRQEPPRGLKSAPPDLDPVSWLENKPAEEDSVDMVVPPGNPPINRDKATGTYLRQVIEAAAMNLLLTDPAELDDQSRILRDAELRAYDDSCALFAAKVNLADRRLWFIGIDEWEEHRPAVKAIVDKFFGYDLADGGLAL